jgi:hypothetical protein
MKQSAALTPVKAIRAKCLDCTSSQPEEVRNCTIKTCALWPYRFGKRPARPSMDAFQEVVLVTNASPILPTLF